MSEESSKLPYVTNPGKIREYFNKILEVETPPKFTLNFLTDVMLFKSTNDRNLISLLKHMAFLDKSGTPTQLYTDYKINESSKIAIAHGIRNAYNEIYRRKNNFHTLDDDSLKSYVKAITRLGENSTVLPLIVRTLRSLIELGDFTHNESPVPHGQEIAIPKPESKDEQKIESQLPFALNYTITINLPNTTNQETYDMIFESIKKVLLNK